MNFNFVGKIIDFLLPSSTYAVYNKTFSVNSEGKPEYKTNVILRFDTIEECVWRSTSNVTSYPTEQGIEYTDYKYQNPDVVYLKGILQRNSALGDLVNKGLGAISSAIFGENRLTNVATIREELTHYKSGMYALNVQTKSGLLENYTLQDFEIPEDFNNFGLLEVIMTFKQITGMSGAKPTSDANKSTISVGIVRLLGLS